MNKQTVTKGTLTEVDPKLISVKDGFNVRQDYGNIDELMNSIVENGLKAPLRGYEKDGKYFLTDGHRRHQAISKAIEAGHPIAKVPFFIEEKGYNEELRTLDLIICNDGKPLSMLEQAEVIRRLLNFGWKVKNVVTKTGKSRGYIENLIMLTKSPLKVQNLMNEGKISAHTVIQIMAATKGDADKITNAVEDAIKTAAATGKTKATSKHIDRKTVKVAGFGSFYKYVDELSETLGNTKEDKIDKMKYTAIVDLLVGFENKMPVKKLVAENFLKKVK